MLKKIKNRIIKILHVLEYWDQRELLLKGVIKWISFSEYLFWHQYKKSCYQKAWFNIFLYCIPIWLHALLEVKMVIYTFWQ